MNKIVEGGTNSILMRKFKCS